VTDLRTLDRPWSKDKIALLVDGDVEIDGDLYTAPSAYELRTAAYSAHYDFADLIVEAAQLDLSIRRGIQRDREVRLAMLLRTRGGYAENEIEEMLGSRRPGYALLSRGIELVRRHERGSHAQLRRVRAHRGESDAPVCWRCLTVEVPRPGDYCGCVEKEAKSFRSKTGPGSTYDPLEQPDPSLMSDEERQAEIDRLRDTQAAGPIPGGEHYRKRVVPMGTNFGNPEDIRAADAYYQRHGYRKAQRSSDG
jgi:hypothetical protein